jgi:hypothetical protein
METQTEAPKGKPCVGIYWGIADGSGPHTIIVDVSTLTDAEPYGNFLTHPRGHYDVWEAWRRLGKLGLAQRGLPDVFRVNEYEDFPRGRVVYDSEHKRFVVYADRRLQNPASVAEIVSAFQLGSEPYIVQSDAHYRSSW